MAESFHFHENLTIGPPGQLDKYKPDSGDVVVEVYDKDENLLVVETFKAGIEAPRNSCYVSANMFVVPYDRENGIAATFTSFNDLKGRAILQWKGSLDMSLPFEVPQYITNKLGAHSMQLWWGSKGRTK